MSKRQCDLRKKNSSAVIIGLFFCFISTKGIAKSGSSLPENAFANVINKIELLNSAREHAAENGLTLESGELCKKVARDLTDLEKSNGYFARQASDRFRNIDHKPNETERKVLREMQFNPELLWKVVLEKRGQEMGTRFYRRVGIESSCLQCHGSKSKRPEFIVREYPNDKAFGYKLGDVRGVYSVWIKN